MDTVETGAETRPGEFIEAEFNYIVDDGVAPVTYIDWPEEEHKTHRGTYKPHPTRVENGRPQRHEFNLRTHGFSFIDHVSAVEDWYDDDDVMTVGYPEVAQVIKDQTGAARVLVFDHTLRTADKDIVSATGARGPVKAVHNDYTERSAPQRVRDLLPADEAEAALKRRFAIVQLWRAVRIPVESEPLAICDGQTIPEKGFITMTRRYRHRTAETYHIAYSPEHRWIYFPKMTPTEALVFKVFDTDADAGVRFTAHSAFDDPTTPPGARLRESIELRALVFF